MKKIVLLVCVCIALAATAQENDARSWFQKGVERHAAGDFRGAAEAYEKARQLNYVPRPMLSLRLARAYAQLGDKERALTILQQLAANGFGSTAMLNAEDELIPLRSDPRWKTTIDQMNHNGHPCLYGPEYRQFDYWLGEWDVQIGGQTLAHSSIQLVLDDCVIFENYTDSRGYAGKSFSIYDATSKKWEQRYVDTGGSFHTWTGGLENGRMVFYWKTTPLQRMTYEKEGPDRVRQTIDSSTNDGKSWTPQYNGLYIRRK